MTLKDLNEKIREAVNEEDDCTGVYVVGDELRCWSTEYPEDGHIAIPFPQKRKDPSVERDTVQDRLWVMTNSKSVGPVLALAAVIEYHRIYGNKRPK